MTQIQKHWLFSSIQTFLTGFILAIIPFISTFDFKHFDKAIFVGLFGAGLRAGFKALGTVIMPNDGKIVGSQSTVSSDSPSS